MGWPCGPIRHKSACPADHQRLSICTRQGQALRALRGLDVYRHLSPHRAINPNSQTSNSKNSQRLRSESKGLPSFKPKVPPAQVNTAQAAIKYRAFTTQLPPCARPKTSIARARGRICPHASHPDDPPTRTSTGLRGCASTTVRQGQCIWHCIGWLSGQCGQWGAASGRWALLGGGLPQRHGH